MALKRNLTIEQRMERIEAGLERLNNKITNLLIRQNKKLWVKASVITDFTGWNKYGLRDAREYGYIEYEERQENSKKVFWYNLNSLDPRFIKQPEKAGL